MLSLQQIQYEYYNRLRRLTLLKKQYELAKLSKINNIRQFIKAGGDPLNSEWKEDYLCLMAESNGSYFVFDDNVGNSVLLTKEDLQSSLKDNNQ